MNKSKSSLFLMELIIVIFFFSLTAAVCLQLFVKAHLLSRDTKEINSAVLWAENAGELFYEYGENFSDECGTLFEDVPANYSVILNPRSDSDFLYLDFSYIYVPDSREIYSVSFKQHIKEVKD